MSKTGSRKNKVLKAVKKSHVWPTILLCLIVAGVASAFIFIFTSVFGSYVADSKFTDEYEAVAYMAKLYDKNSAEEGENIYSFLNEEGRIYFITDNHGNIIYQNGENTMGTTSGTLTLPVSDSGRSEDVRIYLDNITEGFFEPDEDGDISLKLPSLIKFAMSVQNEVNLKLGLTRASFDLPLWIAIDVKDGKQVFYGKASFRVSFTDILFLIVFVAVGLVLIFCIVLLMVINFITTVSAKKKMTKVFFTDPITEGNNWMWFTYYGEQLLKKRRSASENYAVLDVVFVKYRNYCVCHSVSEGAQMLRKVTRVLKDSTGKKELDAHYASANFALLLRFKTKEELEQRINDIISKLEQIGGNHRCTFHVGAYIIEKTTDKNGKVIRRKDIDIEREYNNACTARAMLEDCDDSGVAFFDQELVDEQKWIDTVLEKHEKALENDEFVVFYQPKCDPKTNKLKGVEALIRWDSPELGFKSPGTFIPILEKNGLIHKIDHYMITHVARDQRAWLDAGYKCVPASVNVSRAHFIEKDLAEQIRDAVDKEGTPRNLLEIELTESAFFDDKKAMIDTIRRLKEYGFLVSMDDFGSGYSSLNSLKDMPLDILKLDAEFFRGDVNGGRGEIVISETIKLAKNLNMVTVAEGVEMKEQVDFLADKGCDMIQGFFFSEPLPKEKFVERMMQAEGFVSPKAAKEANAESEAEPAAEVQNTVSEETPIAPEPAAEVQNTVQEEKPEVSEPAKEANAESKAEPAAEAMNTVPEEEKSEVSEPEKAVQNTESEEETHAETAD